MATNIPATTSGITSLKTIFIQNLVKDKYLPVESKLQLKSYTAAEKGTNSTKKAG